MREMQSVNLARTQITPLIRVSTAAVAYPHERWGGSRYQVETFIFSDDPRQRVHQIIHGSQSCGESEPFLEECRLVEEARHVHARIAANLLAKFAQPVTA